MERNFWEEASKNFEESIFHKIYNPGRLKEFLERTIPFPLKGRNILDVGTGTGIVASSLKRLGGTNVVALDLSMGMLKRCREKGLGNLVNGNGELLPFKSESFDLVVSRNYLCVTENPKRASWELGRVLKKGGFALLIEGYYLSPAAKNHLTTPIVEGLMEAGLEVCVERRVDGDMCPILAKKLLVPLWRTDLIMGYKLR